jgi:ribonucleoside-triphosphate reductase
MSTQSRIRGIRILKAVGSPLRIQILNNLFDRGPLTYTELVSALKMNPSHDAGRFAYHLKSLLKADLVEADANTRKYLLTDLGKLVVETADRIDKKALHPKNILIRSSRAAIEEFDPNKIVNALIHEAKMPSEEAEKVAKEAEKQLLRAKTKYLTAPLVREVVNAILIEKGLEEYRHKLTRLGIPVYDVAIQLENQQSITQIAGQTVLKEYVLLNALPRDIADAHMSGAIHIHSLHTWILKPAEIIHDARHYFQHGLNLESIDSTKPAIPPPQNLTTALTTVFNALVHAAKETEDMQTLEYFNVFLAPYTRGTDPAVSKQALREFIIALAQHVSTGLSIELVTPDHVAKETARVPKPAGKYADYEEETQRVASQILEIIEEQSLNKPLLNPRLIIKIRPETQTNPRAHALLLKAHKLAVETGIPYFSNHMDKTQKQTVHTPTGFRLDADLDNDWETDTLRTGLLGTVTVNLPHAAVEAEKDKTRFYEIVRERIEMAARALEIKYRALRQHGKTQLPFLAQQENGDQYYRIENAARVINFAGITQAAEIFAGNPLPDDKTHSFIEETAQTIMAFINRIGRKRGKRLLPATLPAQKTNERLAIVDAERYGIGKIRYAGTRDKPYYTTIARLNLQNNIADPLRDTLENLRAGGNLTVIELGATPEQPDQLLNITKQLLENKTEFFTYNLKQTYCINCKKISLGNLHKCPNCGSVTMLTYYNRHANT